MPPSDLHPAFVAALEQERVHLNTRFSRCRHEGSSPDGSAMLQHLTESVEPLIRKIHNEQPERVRTALVGLFEVSLDLLAARLLGQETKTPFVARLWQELFPLIPKLIAREPERATGCLSNAMFNVANQPGARPDAWLSRMRASIPLCDSIDQLLDSSTVAAWQAGMTQFRAAAMMKARALPTPLLARLLAAPQDLSQIQANHLLERLEINPWTTVEAALSGKVPASLVQPVGSTGEFRGFGGVFLRPPRVTSQQGSLIADDGESAWRLFADAYGSYFHRLGKSKSPAGRPQEAKGVTVDSNGTIKWNGASAHFDHIARATSFASDGTTLAVTLPTSHQIFLFTRYGAGV